MEGKRSLTNRWEEQTKSPGLRKHTRSAPEDGKKGWGPCYTQRQGSALDTAGCKMMHKARSDKWLD